MVATCLVLAGVAHPARATGDRGAGAVTSATITDDDAPLAEGDTPLYLQVILNRTDSGQLARFTQSDGRLRASVATLRRIGLRLDGEDASTWRFLDGIAGITVHYDAAAQTLAIDAPSSLLTLDTTRLNARPDDIPRAQSSPGLLLNYDLYGSRARAADDISIATELRAFGLGDGVLSNTAISRSQQVDDQRRVFDTVRLDTRWDWSFPDSAITLGIGDTVSTSLGWTRGVRMGGVRIGRDFALQPYQVTTPLPAFLGDAAVPSAVELYVNGIRQYRGDVPAGPFQLATVPGISGAGNAQVVVTDAFGRTRTLDFPFYATQQLLAKGLSDWSVNVGAVRRDYGTRSFVYSDDVVGSGSLRYGISDAFTIETHGEGGGGLANGGAGALWLLGRAGVASASYARSRHDGRSGGQRAFGYNWSNGRFNVSFDSQRTQGDYIDVAALAGSTPADISERALAGVNLPRVGSLSLSYVRLRYRAGRLQDAFGNVFDNPVDGELVNGYDSRYAGLFWSQTFGRSWSVSVSVNQNLDDTHDRLVYAGVTVSLDDRRQMSIALQRNGDRNSAVVDVSQPVPGDGELGGYGWRVQAQAGDGSSGGLAEVGWAGKAGRYGAGIASVAGSRYGYANASGSLVLMAGHMFAARNVSDAFAVVSTDGIAGVPVSLENRPIGNTDANGLLLVTPLNAWQRNKVAIDPMDLAADLRIDRVDLDAVPRDRSGTRVRFAMQRVRSAVVVLRDAAGKSLPVGSEVRIVGANTASSPAVAVVGYDGETYLEDVGARTQLHVTWPEGACDTGFAYPAAAGPVPRIGPLLCRAGGTRP